MASRLSAHLGSVGPASRAVLVSGHAFVLAHALALAGERSAHADDAAASHDSDKLACIAADTDGQGLRLKGEFRAARRRFTACSADRCPKVVQDDCLERIRALTRAQPWVIFDATNGRGRVLRAVQVFLDDRLLTEHLDGRPIGVDPGAHVFTFKALGRSGGELKVTLREGEWERYPVVLKTFAPGLVEEADEPVAASELPPLLQAAPPAAVALPPSAPVVEVAQVAPVAGTSPALFDVGSTRGRLEIAAAGVGAAGLVLGGVLGALTFSTWRTAKSDCTRGCGPDSQARTLASQASTEGVVSTVAFVAGGSALAAGTVLWLTDRGSTSAVGLGIHPGAGPARGQVTLQGRF